MGCVAQKRLAWTFFCCCCCCFQPWCVVNILPFFFGFINFPIYPPPPHTPYFWQLYFSDNLARIWPVPCADPGLCRLWKGGGKNAWYGWKLPRWAGSCSAKISCWLSSRVCVYVRVMHCVIPPVEAVFFSYNLTILINQKSHVNWKWCSVSK